MQHMPRPVTDCAELRLIRPQGLRAQAALLCEWTSCSGRRLLRGIVTRAERAIHHPLIARPKRGRIPLCRMAL